jgi:hypothetical protein
MDLEAMTEEEFEAEEFRLQPDVDHTDIFPEELYFDEPQPAPKVWKPAISENEIQASALRFAHAILTFSRTHQAAKLRLLAARNLISGSPSVEQIMRRMKVSKRQVQRAKRFVRAYCGVPRNVARPSG